MAKTVHDLYGGGETYAPPTLAEWAEHSAVADIESGRKFKAVQEVPNLILIDESVENTTYIGETKPGTNATLSLWRIRRVLETGSYTFVEFADGNDQFDNSWSARASLSYS